MHVRRAVEFLSTTIRGERGAGHEEQHQRQAIGNPLQAPEHLPHLGGHEEEGHDKKQQRKGAGHGRAGDAERVDRALQRPTQQRYQRVTGYDVGAGEECELNAERNRGAGRFTEQHVTEGRTEHIDPEFHFADTRRSAEEGLLANEVQKHPCDEQAHDGGSELNGAI